MMTWAQLYDPFGNRLLSTAVAALPVLTLFFVLVVLKRRVWVSALSGLLMSVALALLVFGMPAVLVATAAGHGFIFGVMRIAWIVVSSIFLYNVASTTGQFQVMKESIAGLSSDKRLQLVLIAFCFGAFLEGTGGGGAPVAGWASRRFRPRRSASSPTLPRSRGEASAIRSGCSPALPACRKPSSVRWPDASWRRCR
jgi:lactate permease